MKLLLSSINVDIPIQHDTEIIGGWVGDGLDKFGGWTDAQLQKLGDAICTGIYNGFVAIIDSICEATFWIAKVGIISCIIVFIASKDRKTISLGIKLVLIYIIATVVNASL